MALGATIALLLIAALIDLIAGGSHPDALGRMTPVAAGAPYSVAVLPFQSISRGGDDAQLGRGISEMVINRLAGERELSVIASDSALAPRGEAESAIEAGRRLGAHYVVDGSIQREGAQVRVDAQLIDVNEGRHVGALLVERSMGRSRSRIRFVGFCAREDIGKFSGRLTGEAIYRMTRHTRSRLRARVLQGLQPAIGIAALLAFHIEPRPRPISVRAGLCSTRTPDCAAVS